MIFTKWTVSIRIISIYLTISLLVIFCTFWLSDFREFAGIAVGYAAFSSVVVVLTKLASFIAFADGKFTATGLERLFQVISAGFLKFIAPPLMIYWGVRRGFSPLFMALGLAFGLLVMVLTLVIFNRLERARTREKIV